MSRRRFNNFIPPLPRVNRVAKASLSAQPEGGARRRVMSARPSGEIVWRDWREHETARTNLAIQKAVAAENKWK